MPKNIVLLSDGTGNSAAKPFKTNVWRLYQAIDINPPRTDHEPEQVVYYDDGVGTGNFKPLAYLGLALGLGLQKNVKNLYTFLCRNYSEGDNIFLFGFSRGAFTVRVLAGMIARCGLVHAENEQLLTEQVELVYNAYKWDGVRRAATTGRAKLFRLFLWLIGRYAIGRNLNYVPLGKNIVQRFPRIAFIGVWDTVDAYGVPVDEIKIAIDRFVYPMTLADRDLSPLVDRACQALSLDDERPTFRPVLWNEVRKIQGGPEPVPDEQLMQVWFPGVHANIGGGYPDDGLAYVAMQWMMDEAQREGLWFYQEARKQVDCNANEHGKQYDSRSGVAGYYRYGPRDVDALCNDVDHGVAVKLPKVHASALDRIRAWEVPYAPVSFPSRYALMEREASAAGAPPRLERQSPPVTDDIADRVEDMKIAWDAVARKRWAYITTVWLTVILAVLPMLDRVPFPGFRLPSRLITVGGDQIRQVPGLSAWLPWFEDKLSLLIGYIPSLVGGWTRPWIQWYQTHPLFFLIAGSILAWLFVRKSALLQREVFEHADYAWRRIRASAPAAAPLRPLVNPVVHFLRETPFTRGFYRIFTERVVPFIIALLAPLWLIIAIVYIPKTIRLAELRHKYRVRREPQKTGTEPIVPIERKRCPIQGYSAPERIIA